MTAPVPGTLRAGTPAPAFECLLVPTLDALEPARLALVAELGRHGVDRKAVYICELVLEELLTNLMFHRRACDVDGRVRIEVRVAADEIRLLVEDHGPAFDPTSLPEPQLPSTIEEARPGGLGLMLVRRLSRSMVYSRRAGLNRIDVLVARTHAPQGTD